MTNNGQKINWTYKDQIRTKDYKDWQIKGKDDCQIDETDDGQVMKLLTWRRMKTTSEW